MRGRWAAAASIGLALGLYTPAPEARAGATVDLLFVAINGAPISPTNTVTVAPGALLDMVVRMSNDQTLTAALFSLNYDTDGDDELDVVSAIQWRGVRINAAGTAFFQPIGSLEPPTPTFVGSFQGATTDFATPGTLPPAGGAFAGGYQMGTVVWHVNPGANSDGVDIVSGILNPNTDGFLDGGFNSINDLVLFRGATVNIIPEPATAGLLGLGLVGLVLAARRRSA